MIISFAVNVSVREVHIQGVNYVEVFSGFGRDVQAKLIASVGGPVVAVD